MSNPLHSSLPILTRLAEFFQCDGGRARGIVFCFPLIEG
jgi:hypothetical protein